MGEVLLLVMFNRGNVLKLLYFHKHLDKNEQKLKQERRRKSKKRVSERNEGWSGFCVSSEKLIERWWGGEHSEVYLQSCGSRLPVPFWSC